MNGDPYRTPQPADRRVVNRSGQAYRQADEPQPVKEEAPAPAPKSTPRSSGSHHQASPAKKPSKVVVWIISAILLLAVIAMAATVFLNSGAKTAETGINSSRYQAVFLVNGQIYFGKLTAFNDASFKLTDIYYPQAQTTGEDEKTTDAQGGIQLIKLGDEVHGPESEMFISKDQILYYENLKADSKVAELIKQNGQ